MEPSNPRCQSCGMPLGEGFYGTEKNGKETFEYCKYCFEKGKFTEPNLTVEELMERSITHMQQEIGFSEPKARVLARNVIPHLKRWAQSVPSEV